MHAIPALEEEAADRIGKLFDAPADGDAPVDGDSIHPDDGEEDEALMTGSQPKGAG